MSSTILLSLQSELVRYALYIILIFGTIGNLFTMILFSHRRQSSCAMYLLSASIMNNAYILSNLPVNIYGLYHQHPTNIFPSACKILYYTGLAWSQTATYLSVIACLDRFILTTNHTHSRIFNRPLIAKYVIGFTVIFWHIISIHMLILITINNGFCSPVGIYDIILFGFLAIVASIIPPVLMTIFAFLTYQNMRKIHKRIQPVVNINDRNNRNITINRQDRDLFQMVLSQAIVYVLTTLPYIVSSFAIRLTNYIGINKSIERMEIESFISSISVLFVYANFAVPFYTYFIASKSFRKKFKDLFIKFKHTRIEQNNTNLNVRVTQQHLQT